MICVFNKPYKKLIELEETLVTTAVTTGHWKAIRTTESRFSKIGVSVQKFYPWPLCVKNLNVDARL